MMCPDCGRLRHDGECEPHDGEPDFLEMLAIDAAQAANRLKLAMNQRAAEGRSQHEVNNERAR